MAGKVGIYVGGDKQYEFEPANAGENWYLTPQRNRRPISPGGAELREGKKVIGHVERVSARGLRWLITYKPVPVVVKKSTRKPRRKKVEPAATPEIASDPPESDISPVSEDES